MKQYKKGQIGGPLTKVRKTSTLEQEASIEAKRLMPKKLTAYQKALRKWTVN